MSSIDQTPDNDDSWQIALRSADKTEIAEVEVNIEDKNDNAPVFPYRKYELNLPEGWQKDESINLDGFQATDKDSSKYNYTRIVLVIDNNLVTWYAHQWDGKQGVRGTT